MKIRARARKVIEKDAKRDNRKKNIETIVWGPTQIPEGFILMVDTREQLPLFDPIPRGLCIVRDTVPVGDYSILGFQDRICVERKMESDFFTYIGRDRDATVRKLERMAAMDFAALVVEADEYDLYNPSVPTKMTREHVRGFMRCVRVRYGIHLYCNSSHSEVERYVLDSLAYAYEKIRGDVLIGKANGRTPAA
jgi:ERCC4-type nuclease